MIALLRFADLKARGIVDSWPQLKIMQQRHGFPPGKMLSPNVRTWTEEEIDAYYASRPVENARPLQGAPKARRERRMKASTPAAAVDAA
jgi:predicted DNA-binding transcriptional regulator AlpA